MHIYDVYCINMPLRLLRFVILVFASRRLFGVEFTLIGGMISHSGFRLLWVISQCVFFLAYCFVVVATITMDRAGFWGYVVF